MGGRVSIERPLSRADGAVRQQGQQAGSNASYWKDSKECITCTRGYKCHSAAALAVGSREGRFFGGTALLLARGKVSWKHQRLFSNGNFQVVSPDIRQRSAAPRLHSTPNVPRYSAAVVGAVHVSRTLSESRSQRGDPIVAVTLV